MPMYDVSKLKTPADARNVLDNATKKGRHDVYQLAFRRLTELEGEAYEDPIARQFWAAVAAIEETSRQKHGKALKALATRKKAAKVGEIACLNDWAIKKEQPDGFDMLVTAGLGDQTGEYVVVQNAEHFSPEAVSAARSRLEERGVVV